MIWSWGSDSTSTFCARGRNVAAKADQFAADGEVIDHLGIVARRIGRDRGPGQTHEIGGAAKFLQARVILEKRLQRDGRGEGVLLDAGGGEFKDALVDGVEEMLGLDQRGDAVIDIVVGQNRAQKLLLGLDIVRQDVGFGCGGRQDCRSVASSFMLCPLSGIVGIWPAGSEWPQNPD